MNQQKAKRKHPNQQQLSDFVHGLLPPNQQAAVERHVEKCGECVLKLEQVAGDTLGNRLKALATHFDDLPASDGSASIPAELANHERYEVIERIGVGGMGEVYRARQRVMDRPVAIKVLRRHLFENDRAIARFQNEVKVAAKLNHANIVHSYDAEVSRGLNLLVMELVDGEKLSDRVSQQSTLTPCQASQITIEVAKGLKYAHEVGMIHRDIKPQNIMVLSNLAVKITDFGLGKFVRDSVESRDDSLTFEGETFGTPDYIAPEQIRDSSAADFRSDIYSLGCTLYFMLSGRPPFSDLSVGEKLAGHLEREPVPIQQLRPGIPNPLINVVQRMMNKNPELRYQDYQEVIDQLEPLSQSDFVDPVLAFDAPLSEVAGETAADLRPLVTPLPARSVKRGNQWTRRIVLGAALLMLFSGLGFGVYQFWPDSKSKPKPVAGDGKVHLAVVLPAEYAYHRELHQLQRACRDYPKFEIHYIAEKKGAVTFDTTSSNDLQMKISIDRTLADVTPDEFDAIMFTGGWDGRGATSTRYAYDPKLNAEAKVFVKTMLEQGKPVASVCGGTAVLAFAGILDGKRAASCRFIQDAMDASKARWTKVESNLNNCVMVRDGLVVTGGNAVNVREIVQTLAAMTDSN